MGKTSEISSLTAKEFFSRLDLSKLDTNTANYIRQDILSFENLKLLDGTTEFDEVRAMIEENYPQALGIIPVPDKDIESKKTEPVKKEITGKVKVNKQEQKRIEKEEKEAAKQKHKQEVEEIEGLVELMEDTVKSNPNDTDSKDYLELLQDTLKELRKKKFEDGGGLGDDDKDDSLKLEYIGELIVNGYTNGIDPNWLLKIDFDGEIDEDDRRHIANLVVQGYTSGEIISGEESKRGWWSIEIGESMAKGGSVTVSELNDLISEINEEGGGEFSLSGAYGYQELWAKDKDGGNHRIEVGSKRDIREALIKNRYNKKYNPKYASDEMAKGGSFGNPVISKIHNAIEKKRPKNYSELIDVVNSLTLPSYGWNANNVYFMGAYQGVRVFVHDSKQKQYQLPSKTEAYGILEHKELPSIIVDNEGKEIKNKMSNGGGVGEEDKYKEVNGTYYYKNTPQEVINILERARQDGTRLKLYYGDRETGRDWHETNDVTGTIGRSTGSKKIPLLIATSRSHGGGAILTDSIVKIKDTKTGRVLYQHKNYIAPKVEITPSDLPDYTHNVVVDGEIYGRHKSLKSAEILKNKLMSDGGGVGDNKDVLPPAGKYSEYLQLVSSKFGITIDEARNKYGSYTIGQWEELLSSNNEESNTELEGKFVYKFHEERGELSAYVEDMATGKEVWSFKYPDYSLPEDEREFQSTPVSDGFMRHWEDISGLENYLKDLSVLPDNAELLSEVEANNKYDYYERGGGIRSWFSRSKPKENVPHEYEVNVTRKDGSTDNPIFGSLQAAESHKTNMERLGHEATIKPIFKKGGGISDEIKETEERLRYAKEFNPHKVSVYEERLKELKSRKVEKIELYDNVHIPSINKSGLVINLFEENGKERCAVEFVDGTAKKFDCSSVEKIKNLKNGGGVGEGKLTISNLKKGDLLKKKGSAIELEVVEVGNENGYDYVKLYNDVTGSKNSYVDISDFVLSDRSPYPQYNKGGDVDGLSDNDYFEVVNHFVYFCLNYPRNFFDAFGSEGDYIRQHIQSKFNSYYDKYGSYGVMTKFWLELDGKNKEKLADWIKKNYKGQKLNYSGDTTGIIDHFAYFTQNYPDNFMDAFGSEGKNIREHIQHKFNSYYKKYGSYGVMIKFWVELDAENEKLFASWIKKNYTGHSLRYSNGGGVGKESTRSYIHGRKTQGDFEYIETFYDKQSALKKKEELEKEGRKAKIRSKYKGESDEEHLVYATPKSKLSNGGGVGNKKAYVVNYLKNENSRQVKTVVVIASSEDEAKDIAYEEVDGYYDVAEIDSMSIKEAKEMALLPKGKYSNGGGVESQFNNDTQTWFDGLADLSGQMKGHEGLEKLIAITNKAATKNNVTEFKKILKKCDCPNPELKKNILAQLDKVLSQKYKKEFRFAFGGNRGSGGKASAASEFFSMFNQAATYNTYAKGGGVDNRKKLISKIKNIISEYGGVTIGELGEESILLEKDKKDEEWMIEGFNSDSVTVVKYVHGSEVADNKVTYEELDKEILEKIYELIKDYTGDTMSNGGSLKNKDRVEIVLKHYLIAALWSSTDSDNDNEPFDNDYKVNDFDKKSVDKARKLIIKFMMDNESDLKASGLSDEQIGHDLWLTQVGHGAGFWDRGLPKELGDKLSSEAKKLGQSATLFAQKGKVHIESLNDVDEMAKGGGIDSKPRHFRYLTIQQVKGGLEISLNEEGIEEAKELKSNDKSDLEIWSDLFEDVRGNSEYIFHDDMGDSGFGLTSAEGITDGYYYEGEDRHNLYKTDYPESAKVYWFPNYAVESSLDTMIEKGKVFFTEAESMKHGGKLWIKDALSGGKNKGALRRTAMRKGLLRNEKENLSKTDLHKLEKMGGKTSKRAYLAETLSKFDTGGSVDWTDLSAIVPSGIKMEEKNAGQGNAELILTSNGKVIAKFWFNMRGYNPDFSMKNKEGVYYELGSDKPKATQLSNFKKGLREGYVLVKQ